MVRLSTIKTCVCVILFIVINLHISLIILRYYDQDKPNIDAKYNSLVNSKKGFKEKTLEVLENVEHKIIEDIEIMFGKKIEDDLTSNHILFKFQHRKTIISFALISNIVNYWLIKLNRDPFYFLDNNSKIISNNYFKKHKRKFLITDFE